MGIGIVPGKDSTVRKSLVIEVLELATHWVPPLGSKDINAQGSTFKKRCRGSKHTEALEGRWAPRIESDACTNSSSSVVPEQCLKLKVGFGVAAHNVRTKTGTRAA